MRIIKIKDSNGELSEFEFMDDCAMNMNLWLIGREKALAHIVMREDGMGPFLVREDDIVEVREGSRMDEIKLLTAMDRVDMFATDSSDCIPSDI